MNVKLISRILYFIPFGYFLFFVPSSFAEDLLLVNLPIQEMRPDITHELILALRQLFTKNKIRTNLQESGITTSSSTLIKALEESQEAQLDFQDKKAIQILQNALDHFQNKKIPRSYYFTTIAVPMPIAATALTTATTMGGINNAMAEPMLPSQNPVS